MECSVRCWRQVVFEEVLLSGPIDEVLLCRTLCGLWGCGPRWLRSARNSFTRRYPWYDLRSPACPQCCGQSFSSFTCSRCLIPRPSEIAHASCVSSPTSSGWLWQRWTNATPTLGCFVGHQLFYLVNSLLFSGCCGGFVHPCQGRMERTAVCCDLEQLYQTTTCPRMFSADGWAARKRPPVTLGNPHGRLRLPWAALLGTSSFTWWTPCSSTYIYNIYLSIYLI